MLFRSVRTDGAEIVPNDAPEIMNLLKELWATGCTKKVTEGVLGCLLYTSIVHVVMFLVKMLIQRKDTFFWQTVRIFV